MYRKWDMFKNLKKRKCPVMFLYFWFVFFWFVWFFFSLAWCVFASKYAFLLKILRNLQIWTPEVIFLWDFYFFFWPRHMYRKWDMFKNLKKRKCPVMFLYFWFVFFWFVLIFFYFFSRSLDTRGGRWMFFGRPPCACIMVRDRVWGTGCEARWTSGDVRWHSDIYMYTYIYTYIYICGTTIEVVCCLFPPYVSF